MGRGTWTHGGCRGGALQRRLLATAEVPDGPPRHQSW
jgi:hypothetical protein